MKTGKILSIAFGIIVMGAWVLPSFETIKELEKGVESLQIEKDKKLDEVKALEAIQEEGENKSESTLGAIPFSREQGQLIQSLRSIAARSGIVFRDLSFGKSENATIGAAQTTVSFSIEGPKRNIPTFLANVEGSNRFLGMDNLNVTMKETQNGTLASLNVVLYALSQDLSE